MGAVAHDVQPVRRASGRWWRCWRGRIAAPRKTHAAAAAVELVSYGMFGGVRLRVLHRWCRAWCRPTAQSPQASLLWLVQVQRLLLVGGGRGGAWFARETSWAPTFQRLAFGDRGRILPAPRDQRARSRGTPITMAASTTSRGSCRSWAICGPRSTRRRPPPTRRAALEASADRAGAAVARRRCLLIPLDRLRAAAACSRSAIRATRSGCC